MKTPILGGDYVTRSNSAGANRLINMYPEEVPEGGKEPAFLSRCPGLDKKVEVGTGPFRGRKETNDCVYIVSGTSLYKLTAGYVVTSLGTVPGTTYVSMAFNGVQLMLACNPQGFIYNTVTNVFAEITDPDFPGAVTVDYLDGYFVFNEPDSQKIWVTSLLDGTEIDALEFASAEGNPDNLIGIKVDHREAWLFGKDSIEVYYNSGALDFPLTRIQGAYIEVGCTAPHSIAKLDNSLFWLGSDSRGTGIIYRADGYSGKRISNHSVETAIQSFSVLDDAVAYSYQQIGHSFYVITFPTEDRTFVYDIATTEWHERADFYNKEFHQHRSRGHFVLNNQPHVGDFEDGSIYAFSLEKYYDTGRTQKWLRSWRAIPAGKNTLKQVIYNQLQLDCEVAVGLNTGQGSAPLVVLRWSDDGGYTWSNEHYGDLGKLGNTYKRVIWKRLGRSRDRIFELSGTDPNKIIILGAEIQITKTNA